MPMPLTINKSLLKNLIRVMAAGLTISFLGSLPLGTMNIAATHIAIQQGTSAALVYAAGSMITEIIIVRFSLLAMTWLLKQHRAFHFLELFTVLLLFILAMASFAAAYKMTGFTSALPAQRVSPFWTGVFLSVTNPLHIPFWMGWSTVLLNKRLLIPEPLYYNGYITGIGAGTMLGFMVFIYGGSHLVNQVAQHQNLLNIIIGTTLLATAFLQLKKIMAAHSSTRYGKKIV